MRKGRKPTTPGESEDIRGKAEAARIFGCNIHGVTVVQEKDPFNPENTISGFICRDDGPFFGSVLMTSVNGQTFGESQIVYGMPQTNDVFKYGNPSKGGNRGNNDSGNGSENKNPWLLIEATARIYIANKWNGANVSVFKYVNPAGQTFLSLKPRGCLFLRQGSDPLFPAICSYLQLPVTPNGEVTLAGGATHALQAVFPTLEQKNVQSVTYEFVGRLWPQLVKYDFDLKLQPILATMFDGVIMPQGLLGADVNNVSTFDVSSILDENLTGDFGPFDFVHSQLASYSNSYRTAALSLNQQFRATNKLSEGYKTEHFAVEGKIIFLLDSANCLVSRSAMIKLKPSDTSKSHFEMFDPGLQTAVFEALIKLQTKGLQVNIDTLASEMDLTPKLAQKFAGDILNLIKNRPDPTTVPGFSESSSSTQKTSVKNQPRMLVIMGLPGAGKSTIANKLVAAGWMRVNQDEMGNRKACESQARTALTKGQSVIVDRCNFDYEQRAHFLAIAHNLGVNDVRCLWLDVSPQVCKDRVSVRKGHPTIPEGDSGVAIIDRFGSSLVPPVHGEGFCQVVRASSEAEVDEAFNTFASLLLNQ